MRILKKAFLINWHLFGKELVSFDGSTVITGMNGEGKTTLVDALQVVLLGDLRQIKFNSSAHEKATERNIITYLRGKLGTEGEEYIRNQDFTTYVVLEIEHTISKRNFLVGVVFDYFYQTNSETHTFFKIDDEVIQESLFIERNQVKTQFDFIKELKKRKGAKPYTTLAEYYDDLKVLLGGVRNSFFNLLPKAIAFSPITNIRSFVYDYILDEDIRIDVSSMQDYVEQMNEMENTINRTIREIEALEEIEEKYRDYVQLHRLVVRGQYMTKKAAFEIHQENLEQFREQIKVLQSTIEVCISKKRELDKEKEEVFRSYEETLKLIYTNDNARQIRDLKEKIEALEQKVTKLQQNEKNLLYHIKQEVGQQEYIAEFLDEFCNSPELVETFSNHVWEWRQSAGLGVQSFPINMEEKAKVWVETYRAIQKMYYGWDQDMKRFLEEEKKKRDIIFQLEKNNILSNDSPSLKLKRLLSERLVRPDGTPVDVSIVCEVIDVPNELWKNAVEGYLSATKFDLIVEAEYFNEALSWYEQLKYEHQISGVGLVDVDRIRREGKSPKEGSLAEEIVSDNPDALAYVQWLTGDLMKCYSEKELKKHRKAITATCMVYQNFAARQIPFKRYQLPYIGQNAVKVQLEKRKEELQEILDSKQRLEQGISKVDKIIQWKSDKEEIYDKWAEMATEIKTIGAKEDEIYELNHMLFAIDNSEVKALEEKKEKLERKQKDLEDKLREFSREEGSLQKDIQQQEHEVQLKERSFDFLQQDLMEFVLQNEAYMDKNEEQYHEERKTKTPTAILNSYEGWAKGYDTRKKSSWENFIVKRSQFNQNFDFGADPQYSNNEEYRARLGKLMDSGLPAFKEKAQEAKKRAQESFREDVIAKLKEQIERAKDEFRALNDSLKTLQFGTDRYRFVVSGNSSMEMYYKMLTDPLLDSGMSIFSEAFYNDHGLAIDNLFLRIMNSDTYLEAQDFMDYRTYLDFDIEVIDEVGKMMSYSKVALGKSGGETQVPFYVAILASFYHCYQMKRKSDVFRLVIIDEAFNKMDSERVEEAIKFIKQCGFQAIIIAPTGKVQLIAPHLENVLVVVKDKRQSSVIQVKRDNLSSLLGEEEENESFTEENIESFT